MRDLPETAIPLELVTEDGAARFDRRGEPVTAGVALPRGMLRDADVCRLEDAAGNGVPVQTAALDRWGDGSIRWLLLDFPATVADGERPSLALILNEYPAPVPPETVIRIESSRARLVVRTGAATFHFDQDCHFLFSAVENGARSMLDAGRSGVLGEDRSGRAYHLRIDDISLVSPGTLRAVVRIAGALVDGRDRRLVDVSADVHLFAGLGSCRVELTVTNPRRARHRGGCWDLGDAGSVWLRDLSIVFALPDATDGVTRCSPEPSQPLTALETPFELYQDSSGGANWQSPAHVMSTGANACTFKGYQLRTPAGSRPGLRATPIVSRQTGDATLSVSMPRFWQNFPKALGAGDGRLTAGLFPRRHVAPHELQGGERKTHVVVACFGHDTVSDEPLAWTRSPLLAVVSPQHSAAAHVWAPVSRGSAEGRTAYDRAIQSADFPAKREQIDEYGWRHFGDLYADHEAVGHAGLVSHYNNQYDVLAGMATRFAQTGDVSWRVMMDDLASHVSDIDVYHCSTDKAAYNNGLFWHTNHYADAATATHRSYSRRVGAAGGGPSAEHNYTTGLMLHYFLTGCLRSRQTVFQLAGWVLAMDDGARSPWRWLDRGPTGLASATRDPYFHGPGRGAGNSINALLDAYRLSADSRYMDKADALIARCIHPLDDPGALDLLDAERRWSYTVFLQALGKYLDLRLDQGAVDDSFAYARAALLRYANWMAEQECPYLDHPERLEFPTETWAAQDIRKAAVFEYAARYAVTDAEHARFLSCADRFFDISALTLDGMPTRTATRPLALMLAYGFQRPLDARRVGPALARMPAVDTWAGGRRAPFLPYKQRVMKRLALAAVVVLLSLGALTALWTLGARSLNAKHVDHRPERVGILVGHQLRDIKKLGRRVVSDTANPSP